MNRHSSFGPSELGLDRILRQVRADPTCNVRETRALARLNDARRPCHFMKGKRFAMADADWPFVATVRSGVASMSRVTEDGRSQLLVLLFPGDFLGNPRSTFLHYDMKAETDLELSCIPHRAFAAFLEEMPQLLLPLIDMKRDELQATQTWMLLLGRKSARERVASYLVHVAQRAAGADLDETDLVIDPILTRESIAGLVGLTTETVSRQLSDLESDGLIKRLSRGHVEIPDMCSLFSETGGSISSSLDSSN